MQFEFEGKQWVFSSYDYPTRGDVFINDSGNMRRRLSPGQHSYQRLILKPLEIHHTFGGVVWKEGKERRPLRGEIFLSEGHPVYALNNYSCDTYPILIPIALAPDQGG